jgi:signal transduction histidine kinase/ligand-binding sensor domain-containing protein
MGRGPDDARTESDFRRIVGLRRAVVRGLALLTISVHSGLALDAAQPGGYLRSAFTVEDGLLSNNLNAILQTRDGFLWVGTNEGLVRFDGRHFTRIQFLPQASAILVNALAEAPDGALWVGTRGGLARIPSGGSSDPEHTISSLYHPGSGDGDFVQCLHFSRNGDLFVGTLTGLYRFDHGVFSAIIPKLWTSRIEEASNGNLLVITSQGFVEWDGKQIIWHPGLAARLGVAEYGIFHVIEDHAGTIWYCTQAGVARQVGGSIERLEPYGANVVYRLYEDPQGTIWFFQSGSLCRVTAAGRQVVEPNFYARYLTFDRDGDLWAGTRGQGLFRLKHQAVNMFTAADGLPPLGVPTAVLASTDGKLWVGNNCGGLSWFDGQRFHTYSEKDGLTNSCVFSLAQDHNHDILIGTHGGGVFRLRDGHFTQLAALDRTSNRVATAIVPASDGSLWIAYSDGLDRIADGQVRRFTTADGLSSNSLLSAYEDRGGVLWVETTKGIDRLKKDRFVAVLTANSDSTGGGGFGFGEDSFGELFAYGPANATFHVQENGAIRLNGPRITGMAKSRDNLWFCGDGVYRAAPDSLQRWERGRDAPPDYTRFDRADGMNSAECSGGFPNMAITNDGKLWAATEQGVAMLEFSRLRHNDRNPAIFIEKIVIGKAAQAPGRELVLPAGTHHVELHFDAIELASPEAIRMQYRLDDVDREWLDADSNVTAIYSGIPVGTHQFRVRACNSDGVWDSAGIIYQVTQQPYYYETNWFRLLALVVVASIVTGIYRYRLHQIAREFNVRLEERVGERTRIARDLHDTLLQSLQGLMLRLQLVDELLSPGKAKEELEQTLERADQAIAEGRDAVHNLRSSATTTNELAQAVRSVADELAGDGSPTFRLVVEGAVRELHPILRDEVYRIAREALRNAFNHARAHRIEAEITYGERLFRLRIRDDGEGIPPDIVEAGRSGHYGLNGMRERARQAGAKLDVWSSAASGTEIDLSIPGSIAYGKSAYGESAYGEFRRRFPLRLFRKKAV